MKQTKHFVLTVAMLLCSLAASAATTGSDSSTNKTIDSGTCGANLNWSLTEKGELTIWGTGAMRDDTGAMHPWSYAGVSVTKVTLQNGVTSIGDYAFYLCTKLTSITIPESVTSIGNYAFYQCDGLTTVSISNNSKLAEIGNLAFCSCSSLTSITIPESVTLIGGSAFNSCTKLTTVSIPRSSKLTNIGNYAFSDCSSLTAIRIPEGVTSIGKETFLDCEKLATVTIPENSKLTNIGESAFRYCRDLTSIIIPDSVTEIGNSAFYSCEELTTVSISENSKLTNIGEEAFYDCSNLTSITIPEGVTSIEKRTFLNCEKLTTVTVLENSKLTNIGEEAFYWCRTLSSITIPDGVTSIGKDAFFCCEKLTTVTIPENSKLTDIGVGAFDCCYKLTSIFIPEGVTRIESLAFSYCHPLTSISIPEGVTYIGRSAFQFCNKLTTITIPDNVTSIGGFAFNNCSGLTSIIIGSGVTSIGGGAFKDCSNLASITCRAVTPPSIIAYNESYVYAGDDTFLNVDKSIPVYVPTRSINAYRQADFWQEFTNIQPMANVVVGGTCGDNLTWKLTEENELIIEGTGAMYDYTSSDAPWYEYRKFIKSVTISDGVTSIGGDAFRGCDSLTSITIPEGVISIEERAFSGCSSLTSITIPESVNTIGYYAFEDCNNLAEVHIHSIESWCEIDYGSFHILNDVKIIGNPLLYAKNLYIGEDLVTELNIPEGVTMINRGAFCGCTSLTSITIPPSVKSVKQYAFEGCVNLEDVNISSMEAWCNISFEGHYAWGQGANPLIYAENLYLNGELVTDPTIPNTISAIANSTFEGYRKLESVIIPENIINIGNCAFYCSDLKSINIDKSVNSIGIAAFYGCSNLTSVILPESVTSIAESTFEHCSGLISITIPESVTSIEHHAFKDCCSLTTIAIPESVTLIGGSAFYGCSNLSSITCEATTPPTISESFEGVDKSIPVYVPKESVEAYKAAAYWSEFTNIVSLEVPITHITLSESSVILTKGDVLTLTAFVTPDNATDKEVTWSSSNESVAAVDNTGKVTAIAPGAAIITAMANDGSGASASCEVEVGIEPEPEPEPEPEGLAIGKNYRVKNVSTGLYLQVSGNNTNMTLQNKTEGVELEQVFQLEDAEMGMYYIKAVDNENSYYAHVSGWNFNATTKAEDKTPFAIALVETNVYILSQSVSENIGNAGTDASEIGSPVYCDKGVEDNGKWCFEPLTQEENTAYFAALTAASRALLDAAIAHAEDVVTNRSAMLTAEDVDAINRAVQVAKDCKDSAIEAATLNALIVSIDAAVNEAIYVWSLDELNSSTCYAVSTEDRGAWYAEGRRMNSTVKAEVAQDITDTKQQFAFVQSPTTGAYYLYCVGEERFVKVDDKYTILTKRPSQAITFLEGTRSAQFPWVVALNTEDGQKQMAVSNGHNYAVITNYNNLEDVGNTVRFEKVAAFDATNALAAIKVYEEMGEEQCAVPMVEYINGQVVLTCETEDVQFVTHVAAEGTHTYQTSAFDLAAIYTITAYATKEECLNSETITVTLCWIECEDDCEEGEITDILNIPSRPVLIQTNGGTITVNGLAEGTVVKVNDLNGVDLGTAIATGGTTTITTGLTAGSVAIVQMGNHTIKVVIK